MDRAALEVEVNKVLKDDSIHYQDQIKIVVERFAKDDESTAIVHKLIGDVCYPDAPWEVTEHYSEAVRLWDEMGIENLEVADVCEKLALSWREIMSPEEMEEYYLTALKIKEKLLDANDPDLAQLYNNVANAIFYEPEKAIDYHLKALNIRLNNFGENALITAESYYNLGAAYVKNKNYSDGLEYLNKALVIRISEWGEENPDVAMVYGHIGGAYYEQGDFVKALEVFTHAYEILKKTVTAKHPCAKQMKKNLDAAKKQLS